MIIADQISPELSLLISACLRTPYKGDTRQIDFEKCNQLVAWHGIRPLFLSYLEKFELKFPDQDKLISECKSIAFYNLLLTKEYADIHELLRAHGILNFAYKGSYWAEWLYENSSMREFGFSENCY